MRNTSTSTLAFGERPARREPGTANGDADIYTASPAQRAAVVQAAWDNGVRVFHAAYEREAASLGASLKVLASDDNVCVSTTDGDALDRCPDTETGGYDATRAALARKRELLGLAHIPVFHLYDFRRDTHAGARLAGAVRALEEAKAAGEIGQIGATCYDDFDGLADAIEAGTFAPEWVVARLNFFDQRAETRLLPVCAAWGIAVWAAQPFAWVGGVPFVRFPNTWRLRNLCQNFYGFSAGQAHLHWLLGQPGVTGVVASMQTAAQVTENVGALQLKKVPYGLEALFQSFLDMMTGTRAGWRELLADEDWEVRTAAQAFLGRRAGPPS